VNRLQTLEIRRRGLVERSTAQRDALRAGLAPVVQKAAMLDRAMAPARRYPMLSLAIAGAVVLFGSRRLFTLIARGITLYQLLRKI
jgi:hypothetical protein